MFDKKNVILVLILIAIFGGIIAFNHKRPRPVETLSAYISSDSVSIQADNSGKIKSLSVKQDEKVQKGQVIAEIETSKSVVKSVDPSSQTHKPTEQEYENVAIMYKDGVIPQEEYDRSLNQLTKAQDDYEKAVEASDSGNTKQKTFVKKNVSTSKVYAPKDGVVSLSYLNKGETAVKDKPVVLLDSNRPKVTAYFNPKHAGDLKVGKEVNIRIKNYGSKKFTGVIDAVGTEPEMDARNKSLVIPVQISFKDDLNGYTIEKGQPVQVRFKK